MDNTITIKENEVLTGRAFKVFELVDWQYIPVKFDKNFDKTQVFSRLILDI